MQKSVRSDLTSLSCKENSSPDTNFRAAESSGSMMSSRTQVLSRVQLCRLQGAGILPRGPEIAASAPGFTGSLSDASGKEAGFCSVWFFPYMSSSSLLKQRTVSWHPLVTFPHVSVARSGPHGHP